MYWAEILPNTLYSREQNVVAIDIRQEQLDNRVAELKQYGNDVIGIIGNVLDIASLEKVAEEVVANGDRSIFY